MEDNKSILQERAANLSKVANYLSSIETKIITRGFTASRKTKIDLLSHYRFKLASVINNPKKPRGCTRPLLIAINQIDSYLSVLDTKNKDISSISFKDPISKISELKANLESKLDSTVDNSEYWDKAQKEIKKIIDNSEQQSKNLNLISKKDFVVARIPIIPVGDRPLSADKLKKAGLKAEDLAGYTVLYNQIVVGINKSAKETFREKDVSKILDKIISNLESVTNEDLYLVTNEGNPYKGAIWYWLANKYEINSILKSAGGHIKIKHWGFSF